MTAYHRQLNLIIQRVSIDAGNPFDPFGSTPTETTSRVWARREDSQPRNEVEAGTGQFFAVNESPAIPSGRSLRVPWAIGDIIIDEAGQRRQVKGVAQLQQHGGMDGRMVQLLVEGHGGL